MAKLKLTLKNDNPALIKKEEQLIGKIPVEVENIRTDLIKDLSFSELKEIEIRAGKKIYQLQDFFEIEGDAAANIEINGDLSNFKYLGAGMSTGSIKVNGDIGMHVGSEMSGGKIEIDGNAGDWLGAEMTGGLISVSGNAGNYIGAAFRGDKLGMNRGLIYIEGNAGNFVANKMRRGEIIIKGDCGDLLGAQMIAGSVYVFGKCGKRTGAGMKRGTIIAYNDLEILPTFSHNINYSPNFLNIAFKHLESDYGIEIPDQAFNSIYERYTGDNTELGKGEILIWKKD
ncbi:MAG: formylmethanofuran dehydrogenase subunit C [Halanaerobium sp. MDAL1]|jgi:formylmethanofuran dehydrogenase subunit C|nr:MAG: formylmethanofuran dehydrogenase subunit C [Halanaerobium sp. MDAL1]